MKKEKIKHYVPAASNRPQSPPPLTARGGEKTEKPATHPGKKKKLKSSNGTKGMPGFPPNAGNAPGKKTSWGGARHR